MAIDGTSPEGDGMFTTEPIARAAFLTDEAGNVIAWNEGCETLFGVPAQDILGRSMCSLLAGADQQECSARWPDLVRRASTDGLQVDLRVAQSKIFNAALMLAPQYDHDSRLQGCVAAVTTALESDAPESVRLRHMPLSTIVDLFPGTFYAINRERRFVLWNHNLELVQGMTPDEVAASSPLDMFDLAQRPIIAEKMREVFDKGAEVRVEAEVVAKNGHETPMVLCGSRIKCDGQDYLFGLGVDISEQRAQEQQLRLRERALHAASNGIVITRYEGKNSPVEYVNPAFERITGYSSDEVLGRDMRFMAAPGLDVNERAQVREAITQRRPVNIVFRNLRKNGDVFWNDLSITPVLDDHKVVSHCIGVIVDVTATKQRTAHLEHEVNHDALTGLANRNLLWDRLEQALHLAQRNKSLVATVLIDLNNFKTINDTFGHEAGDVVLKVVAKRMQASVRDSDTVARLSGDEFVLVLVNQPSLRFTLRMIERLRHGLTMPVAFNNQEIPVGASVGIAVYPYDGNTVAELVRAADVAMYHAKATGKDEVQFFSADMKSTTEAKQRLESAMRDALERDELFLVYQPRMDIRTGVVKGFEALLRWRHPEQGVILPPSFLTEAEENGCIVQMGNLVLDRACAFIQQLRQNGHTDVAVGVNVSHREYSQHGFVPGINERLRKFGLPPTSLLIELREDALVRSPGLGREVAAQLRALGLPLSVDAFGDGLSDLSYLQDLAPTQMKLAKVAVHSIGGEGAGNAFVKTLIDIGHNLNMEVIAEAVETRAQMEYLKSNGCDHLQGVWFSEPLAPEAAQELLKARQLA
jgi:diguanylate cyclase (GGDEF)-like protein/PAS domain S-box-containing protein